MKELLGSFSAAWQGIRTSVAGQRNVKIHVGIALLVVAAGVYVELGATDWALVALAVGLVLTAELMNTAIETLVDLIEPRQHPLAGKVKDIAAGSVLIAALSAAVIGILVFQKYMNL